MFNGLECEPAESFNRRANRRCGGPHTSQRVVGSFSDGGEMAHLPAAPRASFAVQVQTNPRQCQRALERWRAGLPVFAEQVEDRTRPPNAGVAERQIARRADELLKEHGLGDWAKKSCADAERAR